MYNSFLKPLYQDVKTQVLDLLFPIHCLVCETEGQKFICDNCVNLLTPLAHQYCIVCQKMSLGGLTHPKCQSSHAPDGLITFFDYTDEKISNILIKGKYSFLPQVYKELGVIISNVVKKDFPYIVSIPTVYLTPIPLHWTRNNWRGFNQSKILGESLAKELNLQCVDALVRKKFTKTQKDLKKDERVKNMESAFILSPQFLNTKSPPDFATTKSLRAGVISNHNFLLVDDVATTGSTLREAVKVLKRNGANKVWCLTVARD